MVSNEIDIDRAALERDLKEVGDYLAELRFIDLSLRHIEDRNDLYLAAGQPAHRQEVVVTLGTVFPFQAPAILAPPRVDPQDELAAFYALSEQANHWAANEMDFLRHLVREIMYYPISGYTPMDASLESVWSTLNSRVEDNFGYLADEMGDWSGPAATEFKSLFYHRFEIAKDNQLQLIRTLQGALEVSRRIAEYSQQSVINAVAAGREALREQLHLRSVGDSSTTSSKIALLVLGGAFTVLGVVISPASVLWAAAVTGGGFAAGVAGSELPAAGTEERNIAGRSAEELHLSLLDAVRDVSVFLGQQLDLLHDDLRHARRQIDQLHREHLLLPRRPRLVDGVGAEEFHHNSVEQDPEHR